MGRSTSVKVNIVLCSVAIIPSVPCSLGVGHWPIILLGILSSSILLFLCLQLFYEKKYAREISPDFKILSICPLNQRRITAHSQSKQLAKILSYHTVRHRKIDHLLLVDSLNDPKLKRFNINKKVFIYNIFTMDILTEKNILNHIIKEIYFFKLGIL